MWARSLPLVRQIITISLVNIIRSIILALKPHRERDKTTKIREGRKTQVIPRRDETSCTWVGYTSQVTRERERERERDGRFNHKFIDAAEGELESGSNSVISVTVK